MKKKNKKQKKYRKKEYNMDTLALNIMKHSPMWQLPLDPSKMRKKGPFER